MPYFRLASARLGVAALLLATLALLATPPAAGRSAAPKPSVFEQFASELEFAVASGDPGWFDAHIDKAGIAATVILGYEDGATELNASVARDLKARLDWAPAIVNAVQTQAGMYRSLRVRVVDGRVRALFRLNTREGLNYHDLDLVSDGKDGVLIRDIYVYATGEWMSETLRRRYLQQLHGRYPDVTLAPADAEYLAALPTLRRLDTLTQSGNYRAALDLQATLPEAIRGTKALLLSRAVCAVRLGDADRQAAAAAFAAAYPGDIGYDLILAEASRETGLADAARAAIDRIDAGLGGDPYLHVLRAVIDLRLDRPAVAAKEAAAAVAAEPRLAEAHLMLVAAKLATQDFPGVAAAMTAAETDAAVVFGDIREEAPFAAFRASPAGQKWLEAHPAPAAPSAAPAK